MSLKTSLSIAALLILGIGMPATSQDSSRPSENVAISFGLLVDNSGSLRSQMKQVKEAVANIIDSSAMNDEGFLIRFVDREKIEMLQKLTPDKALLGLGMKQFATEGGATAILDAIYVSSEYLIHDGRPESPGQRRVLVLITDGEDRASFYKLETVIEKLREGKVQIFALGLTTELKTDRGVKANNSAVALLTALANQTGGRVYFPKNAIELQRSAKAILEAARSQ
jgi:Ca-activated chloride channel family protein